MTTGNVTWAGVFMTMVRNGVNSLPVVAVEAAASLITTLFDNTVTPILYTMWETAQYIVYPLFGLILLGILTKVCLQLKQIMLKVKQPDEKEEESALLGARQETST